MTSKQSSNKSTIKSNNKSTNKQTTKQTQTKKINSQNKQADNKQNPKQKTANQKNLQQHSADKQESKDSKKEKQLTKLKSLFSPKKWVVLLAIIISVFALPQVNKDAMSKTEAIVTMMFVDKKDGEFNIALTVLAPGQERNKNLEIYMGGGDSLSKAVDSVSLAVGKEIGFAQCQIMGLGTNICKEGVMQALDYMTRTKKVGRNAVLICYEGEVQKFAQAAKDINTNKNLSLDEIISFDKRYMLSEDSNIESFYIGYFSDLGLGIMPKIKLVKEAELNAIELSSGSTGSTGSSSGMAQQSSSQQSEGDKSYMLNDGTTVVFKDGVLSYTLAPDMIEKVNIFINNHQKNSIKVEHVNDELYKDATVVTDVVKKQTNIKTSFDGNTPVYSVDVTLTDSVAEIAESQLTKSMLRRNQDFLTDALIEKIKEKTINDMNILIDYCKQNKVDLVSAYKHFYRNNYKKWKKYLESKPKEEFLNDIKFEIKVSVKSEF